MGVIFFIDMSIVAKIEELIKEARSIESEYDFNLWISRCGMILDASRGEDSAEQFYIIARKP
jgi:hypothetical protein